MHRAVGSRVSHIYPEDLELDIFPSCAREALRDSPGRATSNLVLGLRGVLLVMGPARMRVAQRDNGTSNVATLSARRAGASRFGRWPLCRRTLCRPDVPERPGSAGGRLAGMRPRIEVVVGRDSNTCHVIARAARRSSFSSLLGPLAVRSSRCCACCRPQSHLLRKQPLKPIVGARDGRREDPTLVF